jgi:hypothetical protein
MHFVERLHVSPLTRESSAFVKLALPLPPEEDL